MRKIKKSSKKKTTKKKSEKKNTKTIKRKKTKLLTYSQWQEKNYNYLVDEFCIENTDKFERFCRGLYKDYKLTIANGE